MMPEKWSASLKDLRSTGYFFDELKNYSASPEMDISTYCGDLAVPYLLRRSDAYDRSGQAGRSKILRLAVEYMSVPTHDELVESIFGLKKLALTEMDEASKLALREELERSESVANRQRLESAEILAKLLVNIIKMFRLSEPGRRGAKSDSGGDSVSTAATMVVMPR